MYTSASNPLELTEQDIVDFIGDDTDSELACLCDALGAKGVLDLVSAYGGCTVYVPNMNALQKAKRDRLITKEFQEGMDIAKLARCYHVTTRTIYSVVYGK